MKKRLGDFTLDEIRAECDRYETCFVCPFEKIVIGCTANQNWGKNLDTEIEIPG